MPAKILAGDTFCQSFGINDLEVPEPGTGDCLWFRQESVAMLYFLRDAITGKWWNQQSYRHHGMWLLHTEYAPPFESEARASAHAKAIGMTMWRVQVVAVDANL